MSNKLSDGIVALLIRPTQKQEAGCKSLQGADNAR